MYGSSIGKVLKITTWGESHGKGIGVVVDGCPAGLPISEQYIQTFLDRRKPGQTRYTTPRKENDSVEILSGVFEGKTTGTPISIVVRNESQRSKDYSEIANFYRPGHADYTFDAKYGFRDYRGGGRSSGRETIGRVAAGAIACALLETLHIQVTAYTKSIGPYTCHTDALYPFRTLADCIQSRNESPLGMPDTKASLAAEQYLASQMEQGDSAGGIIECVISNVTTGLGDPVFDKLDANLAKAIFSIGAVKGFEIGDGFASAASTGTKNNDSFYIADGVPKKCTNHAGGILGGISDGSDIVFRAAVKPTPSISSIQKTINRSGENISVSIKGRHDPIIVPRAIVVVEAMAALTVADALLANMSAKMEYVEKVYGKG